jgi:hypothetical protein
VTGGPSLDVGKIIAKSLGVRRMVSQTPDDGRLNRITRSH